MLKSLFVLAFATLGLSAIDPSPTVGIFCYDIPVALRSLLPIGQFFINESHTKWLETYNIRFVPINMNDPSLATTLATLNGIFIAGGEEAFNSQAQLSAYKEAVNKLVDVATQLNQVKPFSILSTGFGAKLLLGALTADTVTLRQLPASGHSLPLTFQPIDGSQFYSAIKNLDAFRAGLYPINTDFHSSVDDFKKSDLATKNLNVIASAKGLGDGATDYLMAFEHKTLPFFGVVPDLEMIQFNHADFGFTDKSLESVEAAFQFAKFFAIELNKNENYKSEAEVLALKVGWSYYSWAEDSGVFEDFIWK